MARLETGERVRVLTRGSTIALVIDEIGGVLRAKA